jgi:Lipocalin-like domain
MSASLHPDLSRLAGSWRLVSVSTIFSDTKERAEPFGPNPDGRMVLEPGGRIMFLFTKPNRQPPADDAQRAALFNGMVAYTGLIHWDGPGRFIAAVDVAWTPLWSGEQLRFFAIDGDRLTIRSPEQTLPQFPGRMLVGEVVFAREHPPAIASDMRAS